jgi:hypothetical protein
MIRSPLVIAALVLSTVAPGVALAAPATPAPGSCGACGAPFNEAYRGPLLRPNFISRVDPYRVTDTDGKHTKTTMQGAVVQVRPAPGVTREWLQAVVDDRTSRAAASNPDSPLSVEGAAADVASTRDGFAITIHSKDKDAAQEILRRADALVTT